MPWYSLLPPTSPLYPIESFLTRFFIACGILIGGPGWALVVYDVIVYCCRVMRFVVVPGLLGMRVEGEKVGLRDGVGIGAGIGAGEEEEEEEEKDEDEWLYTTSGSEDGSADSDGEEGESLVGDEKGADREIGHIEMVAVDEN